MATCKESINLKCTVDGDDDITFIKVELVDLLGSYITTLEYADITNEFEELCEINDQALIYDDDEQIKKDLARGKLDRVLGNSKAKERLDLLTGLKAKFEHQSGACKDGCIYCNPELGQDPFPDFTFIAKNALPEGTA